jgi:hypothetical protein
VRSSSVASGEGRHGVGAIPAKEGRELDQIRSSGQGFGLRSAGGAGVPFGCVAAARHRRPDVAERGTASGGNAGGGRRGRATRGAR